MAIRTDQLTFVYLLSDFIPRVLMTLCQFKRFVSQMVKLHRRRRELAAAIIARTLTLQGIQTIEICRAFSCHTIPSRLANLFGIRCPIPVCPNQRTRAAIRIGDAVFPGRKIDRWLALSALRAFFHLKKNGAARRSSRPAPRIGCPWASVTNVTRSRRDYCSLPLRKRRASRTSQLR